jgi:hypothetical protein
MASEVSRRRFLAAFAVAPFLTRYHLLAAAEKRRYKIRDVQCMMISGAHLYAG